MSDNSAGTGRRLPRPGRTAAAAVALAAWSVVFLDSTFLEPLSWDAAKLGLVLLLTATLGAGLLSGWRVRTALLLAVMPPALLYLAPTFVSAFGQSEEVDNHALKLLWLYPLAIALGALISRFTQRAQFAGLVLLILPLSVVAWAGFRHLRPLDKTPAHRVLIEWKNIPSYRGLVKGDNKQRVVAVLGKPDRTFPDGSYGVALVYGRDTIGIHNGRLEYFQIFNPNAETPEGVGLGDNMALVKKRFPAQQRDCTYNGDSLTAECDVQLGNSRVSFYHDPITEIAIG